MITAILILNLIVGAAYGAYHVGNKTWKYKGEHAFEDGIPHWPEDTPILPRIKHPKASKFKVFKEGGTVPEEKEVTKLWHEYKEASWTIPLDPPAETYAEAERRGRAEINRILSELNAKPFKVAEEVQKADWLAKQRSMGYNTHIQRHSMEQSLTWKKPLPGLPKGTKNSGWNLQDEGFSGTQESKAFGIMVKDVTTPMWVKPNVK